MSQPFDPYRSVPSATGPAGAPAVSPTGGRVGDDGVIRYGNAAAPAEQTDEHGVIYYPGDEEAQRAPGSALVLLVLSLVAGGLYVWLFWPQKSGFDWASALTLKTPEFAVVGGLVMWGGGVLFIRHGLIWASRTGAVIAAVPMARQLIDSLSGDALITVQPGAATLAFLLAGGPALLVLALSFSPKLNRWRHRRRHSVAAAAQERREKRARIARAQGN